MGFIKNNNSSVGGTGDDRIFKGEGCEDHESPPPKKNTNQETKHLKNTKWAGKMLRGWQTPTASCPWELN